MTRRWTLVMGAAVWVASGPLAGCSTAATYGSVAHYAPGYRGYVLSDLDDGRNPELGGDVLLLLDPIRGEKLRCRRDVERWIAQEVYWHEAEDDASVRALSASPVTLPVGVVGLYAQMIGESSVAVGETVYWTQSTRAARGLYEDAMTAFDGGHYARSASLLEHVIIKPPEARGFDAAPLDHRHNLTHFYLGLSYEQLQQRADAAASLERFVKASMVYDEDRYALAEERLRQLDPSWLAPCDSQGDVEVPWSD